MLITWVAVGIIKVYEVVQYLVLSVNTAARVAPHTARHLVLLAGFCWKYVCMSKAQNYTAKLIDTQYSKGTRTYVGHIGG